MIVFIRALRRVKLPEGFEKPWAFSLRRFIKKNLAVLLLLLIGLIAYGQLMQMNFWQDDNALVFKFNHLNEDAGYLGKGLWGSGPYRYTVASYYLIYRLFGYNPTAFFTYALIFYLLSVLTVYALFRTLFDHRLKGLWAGCLYAAGYVASDGFIRLFNSVLTSLSVIFSSATFIFYFRYFKTRRWWWYLMSIVFYWLSVEFGFIRTHYLITVVIAFELIYFTFRRFKNFMSLIKLIAVSLLRLIPFILIFQRYFLNEDGRAGQMTVLVKAFLAGEFHQSYSFFTGMGNMLLSNQLFPIFYPLFGKIIGRPFSEKITIVILSTLFLAFTIWLIRNKVWSRIFGLASWIVLVLSLLIAKEIFAYPGLVGGLPERVSLYAAIFYSIFGLGLLKGSGNRRLGILLYLWIAVNLLAYNAYNPIFPYPTDNRYLLHSFVPLIGLLTLSAFDLKDRLKNSKMRFLPLILIASYGLINLISSVYRQRYLILHRANPSKRFFSQLKEVVPTFPKGSLFYFYVPEKPYAREHYDAGFGVAQMPEETAVAWRYGLDRYDLIIVNSYDDLIAKISKRKITIDKTYAFIAEQDNLINITDRIRAILESGERVVERLEASSILEVSNNQGSLLRMREAVIKPRSVTSLTPLTVRMLITATPYPKEKIIFPLRVEGFEPGGAVDTKEQRAHLFGYRQWKSKYYSQVEVNASSSWRNFLPNAVVDQDNSTYWEADRVLWDSKKESLIVDLGGKIQIGGLFYRNGPYDLIPTEFEIETSLDGHSFSLAGKFVVSELAKTDVIQKVIFEKTWARYLKVIFRKTLYDDAPAWSELEVIPGEYIDIDPVVAMRFFRRPFSYVESADEWSELMKSFYQNGLVRVSWKVDSSLDMVTGPQATFPLIYDGYPRWVSFTIPASGLKLEKLEILPLTVPGVISISQIIYENLRYLE